MITVALMNIPTTLFDRAGLVLVHFLVETARSLVEVVNSTAETVHSVTKT